MRKYIIIAVLAGCLITWYFAIRAFQKEYQASKRYYEENLRKVVAAAEDDSYEPLDLDYKRMQSFSGNDSFYTEIKSHVDAQTVKKLTALENTMDDIHWFLDSLHIGFDSDTIPAEDQTSTYSYFVTTGNGEQIQKRLLLAEAALTKCALTDDTREKVANALLYLHEFKQAGKFAEAYFEGTARVSAVSFMYKFRSDLRNSEMFILEDYSNLANNNAKH